MPFRILALCRGNIVRSPFVAGYLHHLYRTSELADKVLFDIDSSGIEGKLNQPVHPRVLEKGLELGFDLAMYRSKHSDLKSFQKTDLIIVADKKQYLRFEKNYPQLLDKVYLMYDFGREGDYETLDIVDPTHSDDIVEFESFFELAIAETERVWKHIEKVYYQAVSEGKEFTPDLFRKPERDAVPITKRYNFLTKRFYPICPHCQSKRIRRVKRQGYLQKKVFPKFNGYPYHCGTCNRNSILFIGSEIKSKHRSEKKYDKWYRFMDMDKAKSRAGEESDEM